MVQRVRIYDDPPRQYMTQLIIIVGMLLLWMGNVVFSSRDSIYLEL